MIGRSRGFTLLEVLVALAILSIALTVVLQLFSANIRALSASEDYVSAVTKAESKMREVLDDDMLTEKSWSEITDEGYRIDVSVSSTLKERTENLSIDILRVDLTIHWLKDTKRRSLNIKTLKVVNKQI